MAVGQKEPVKLMIATPDLGLQTALMQAAASETDKVSIVTMAPTASLVRQNLALTQPRS